MRDTASPGLRAASGMFALSGTTLQRIYALIDGAGALRGVTAARTRDEALAAILGDRAGRGLPPNWRLAPATVTWPALPAELSPDTGARE